MFDIGFWEVAVIAVVALLVVGPEEFPGLVRNIGAGLGKIRRFMSETKNDLEREFNKAEELKKRMEREANLAALHEQVDARTIKGEDVPAPQTAATGEDPAQEPGTKDDSGPTHGPQA